MRLSISQWAWAFLTSPNDESPRRNAFRMRSGRQHRNLFNPERIRLLKMPCKAFHAGISSRAHERGWVHKAEQTLQRQRPRQTLRRESGKRPKQGLARLRRE